MKILYLIFFIIIFTTISYSQVVYEPLWHDVYNYLERLSQKGIIEFDDLFKPVSRKYIYEKLLEAQKKSSLLTSLEREELEYFEKDYNLESSGNNDKDNLGFFKADSADRLRMFFYNGDILKLNVSPIIEYGVTWPGNDRNILIKNGLNLYGYLPAKIGFGLNFRFNNEKGSGADRYKRFTPATGIITHRNKYSFDYEDVESMASIDWGWGHAVVAKEFIEYGYAKSGKLVLSNKAPSFPFILFKLKPASWLDFTYFHGWLSSDVIDSVQLAQYRRDIFVSKYFAWHALTVTPLQGLDISVGESVIYSDKIEFAYLMPVMFFFLADNYIRNNHEKPGDANCQFFLSISSKNHLKNTHLYGTMFVDELTIRGIGGSIIPDNTHVLFSSSRLQLGFTLGASVTDLPVENLSSTFEYTKIYPYVYGHHSPAQTYTNASYVMGHWMGQNADLVYLEFNYRLLRGLQGKFYGEYIRKGSNDYSGQYNSSPPPFLFGLKNYYTYLGIDIRYELIHELNIETGFRKNLTSNEQNDGSFSDNRVNKFSFSVYYGF